MNDDDVDFKPSQSTRPRPTDNQTLRYTAPKPPKAGESSSTPVRGTSSKNLGTEKLEIIVSKNIQLYKLENGKYVGQGAAGVAIIGHYDLHMYQIILYKNNKEYLSKTYIQPNFTFTVLENNYASFYDNARQNWSILFPSSSDVHLFAKQVAIAKYNSQSKQEKIIVQDLIPLGSAKANKYDVVKLEYSCSLLNHDDITPLKEKSNWSVEVTDTYAFPWQEGLKDCSYKCKRVVITPYKLSAPWMDEIHESNSVLVEFEVESIRPPEHLGQNKTMPVKAKTQGESTTDSSADDDNCKTKPVSLKDSIFLSRSHKADLISRIAKMGQALPSKVAFACGPSDSSDENSSSSKQANSLRGVDNAGHQQMHQTLPSNFRPCSPQQTDTNQPYLLSSSPSRRCENDIAWQQQQMRGGMNFAYQELHPMMSGPPGPSGQTNVRRTETAGTDAELRITINKVSEKVDHVLNKLQNFDSTGWEKVKAHHSATILDPISVINSIQDVMAENESLKVEIQQQKSKINEQGSKLHSLMELTQRCVERCAYPERKPVATPGTDKIVGLEERLNMSDQLMMEANTRMNQLTREIEKYRKEITENQQQIRQCNTEIQSLVDKLKEKERVIRNMETELVETTAANEALMNANKLQKKEIQTFKEPDEGEKSAEVQPALSCDSVEEIKKVMNAVNRKLQAYFDSDEFYSGKDIKATIATTLKDVTMEYLKYRSKQKTASRLDVERDMSGTNDEKTSHVQLAPEYNNRNLETVEADDWRKEKSEIGIDLIKAGSQRLAFADEQTSQTITNIRERQDEEPMKLHSRQAQESSVHVTGKPSLRRSTDVKVSVDGIKTVESLVQPTADASRLHQSDARRAASSRPIIDASARPTTGASALSHNIKSVEAVGFGLQRESDVPSGISEEVKSMTSQLMRDTNLSSRFKSVDGDQDAVSGKNSGVTATGSSTTSTRTLPGASKTSVMQPSTRRSTLPTSRLPSAGDESIKGDISTMTGELESLLEDHEAENVEVENSTVTLTNTLSDITRGPTAPPSFYRSVKTGKAQTSSTLGTASSYEMDDSRTQSTATTVVQPSETDEQIRKQFSNKSETGTASAAESFVFVEKERSDGTRLGSSKTSREFETRATSGRSVVTVRGKSSEIDDGTTRQKAGDSSRIIAGDESLILVANESSGFVTDMSSEGVVPQESGIRPTPDKSALTARGLTSEMDVSFTKYEFHSKSGTESEDEEQSSVIVENNRFKEGSINRMEASNPASNFAPSTTEREAWDIRKSISETHLNSKLEPVTPGEEGSIANVETEKLSVLLNKTVSNTTRDTSIQGHDELGSDHGSSIREDFEGGDEDKSRPKEEEKNYRTREDMDVNNENENEKDETEKSSTDEKVSSSNSDENFKSSGPKAANESPLYFNYYQGWESSKPPPLPLEDDEESSGTDEEWL